ncbi:MAG: DUF1330 domain-containing protein [Variovorax sp.]|nr:MAG: DUF1330 domain-containing protein [Variovorax sp.]
MPAFCMAEMTIHHPELFAEHRELALPTLAAHGAKPVVRAQDFVLLEGKSAPSSPLVPFSCVGDHHSRCEGICALDRCGSCERRHGNCGRAAWPANASASR